MLILPKTEMYKDILFLKNIQFNINKYNEILKEYIESGEDINIVDENGRTLLMICAGLGLRFSDYPMAANVKGVKLLLDANANLNIKDNGGMTALDHAIIMLKKRKY